MHAITTDGALEERLGKPPSLVFLKTINHLDDGALSWIAASHLMIASLADADRIGIVLAGGAPGWANGDSRHLHLPTAMIDQTDRAVPGASFGSSFLIPSLNEILRVNGQVVANDGVIVRVRVDECYIHCGKALIRSEFWSRASDADVPDQVSFFGQATRFMALASVNSDGRADLSPKGDPAGLMVQFSGDAMWFADRPGNKRIDSFRNIVTQPRVASLLIIPGTNTVVEVTGQATIVDDPEICARFIVGGKVPALVIGIRGLMTRFYDSPSLARAGLWPAPAAPKDVSAAKIGVGHIKLSRSEEAKAVAEQLSPGMIEAGLRADYEKNLY